MFKYYNAETAFFAICYTLIFKSQIFHFIVIAEIAVYLVLYEYSLKSKKVIKINLARLS